MFQSTHPRGVRLGIVQRDNGTIAFQSTHPRGVRLPCTFAIVQALHCFNPRTRVGCDVYVIAETKYGSMFQSTHPRGVRLCRLYALLAFKVVSIHAPAWGATHSGFSDNLVKSVSIHAPAWGATYQPSLKGSRSWFQSTHPRGVRLSGKDSLLSEVAVSIHAPAWGATFAAAVIKFNQYVFQSTHPRGVRHFVLQYIMTNVKFQSTHPRGVRHI